jgi:hypothetical protein
VKNPGPGAGIFCATKYQGPDFTVNSFMMKVFLKRFMIAIGIIAAVFAMIWKCSSNIDQARLEKKERETKLEEGSCVFDTADLSQMTIDNNGIPIKPIENLDYLRKHYPQPLSHISVEDSLHEDQIARISNTEVTLSVYGDFVCITKIGLDLSSEFQLNIHGKRPINSTYELDDFRADFPQSYNFREKLLLTSKTENVIVRIDNSDNGGKLQFVLLYFNFTEQLYQAEFFYDKNLLL